MQVVNHCISKALVEEYGKNTLFVMEDLTGIRNAIEKVRVKDRYQTVSWSFYDLRQKIAYKAQKTGSFGMAVDPRYTSKTCPKCGHTEKANRNKRHTLSVVKCASTHQMMIVSVR